MNTKVDEKTMVNTLEAALAADLKTGTPKTDLPTPERINNSGAGETPRPPLFTQRAPVTGYEELDRILKLAFDQSAQGKGHERHAYSPTGILLPWDQQPILANARQVGPGGPAQQVMKKAGESVTMAGNKNLAGAKAEALGAIVYAAALFKLYEEMDAATRVNLR